MLKFKNIIPVIALGALVTACGGGGTGSVSNIAEKPLRVGPVDLAFPKSSDTFAPFVERAAIARAANNVDGSGHTIETNNAHGELMAGLLPNNNDVGISAKVAPGATVITHTDLSDLSSTVTKDRTNESIRFDSNSATRNAKNASGTALVWEKFDNVAKAQLMEHIDDNIDQNGVISIQRALSPSGTIR